MNTLVQALPIYVQNDVQLGPVDAQMLKEVFEKGGGKAGEGNQMPGNRGCTSSDWRKRKGHLKFP